MRLCSPAPLVALLLLPLTACSGGETPLTRARPGDTLVRSGATQVVLERGFRPGHPNGLYGGIIRVRAAEVGERRWEVNGVCSMPGLQEEGWPAYDNLYGHRLPEAGGDRREQRWQVLFHFDGRVQGRLDAGTAAEQAWLSDLRDNICRRGRFDDRKR
jgi:hypothetical protein